MELRDYVAQAKREPTRQHIEAMWRAVFMLKAWYFLPAADEEGPNRPMVAEIDGQPWLPVFTNVRRYREFAASHARVDGEGNIHSLMLDPGESTRQIVEADDRIAGVVFNPGSEETFRTPVEALVAYAKHFEIPGFDEN